MKILMTDNKDLMITKRDKIYKYETGVDDIKIFIPQIYKNVSIADTSCVILVLLQNLKGDKKGLFKYVAYDEDLYKDKLTITIPVTSTITREECEVRVWLMFLKRNEEDAQYADKVLETNYTSFKVEYNQSEATSSESNFDEMWQHTSIDELQKDVDDLSDKVQDLSDEKADKIIVDENNQLILMSGDNTLCSVQLKEDVIWEEWR